MPIHDWTRVNAGTFHDFHQTWIIEIKRALNAGLLPAGFYAMAEQIAGGWGPDVLTLETPGEEESGSSSSDHISPGQTAVAVEERPPKVAYHAIAEEDRYARKASAIAIRHASGHRVVAVIEIVSPGNKNTSFAVSRFVEKAMDMIEGGIHLVVIDLFPPGPADRDGIHAAIWQHFSSQPPPASPNNLTLARYVGGLECEAYIEPTAVGQSLIDMPLFLEPHAYIPLPLEKTFQAAWEALPKVWQRVLQGATEKN